MLSRPEMATLNGVLPDVPEGFTKCPLNAKLRHNVLLVLACPARFQRSHKRSMLQWWSQKMGSSGDMNVPMLPLIRICTWLCGVLSRGPWTPPRRSHVAAVLFWPVGRLLAKTSKLFSARIDAITAVPVTFVGIVTVCELRVELNSGLGAPIKFPPANAAGSCGF